MITPPSVQWLDALLGVYLLGYVGYHVLFFTVAAVRIIAHRLRLLAAKQEGGLDAWLPPVSIVISAYNEEATVVHAVRSCLRSQYPVFEVIVVNDGSTDGTLQVLADAFELAPTTRPPWARVPFRPVRATYASRKDARLLVIDKENGGRADALNAGVAFSRCHVVACIDADSIVEPDSLFRCAVEFSDPRTVSSGGVVRVLNGCKIQDGAVVETGLPRNPLTVMQAIEYTRAFFVHRPAVEAFNALTIISGAFGLFRRQVVVDTGGFSSQTVAEDMEMVFRLHEQFVSRSVRAAYRQAFVPDPVVWTEVPETPQDLGRQRRRWQCGLAMTLWMYRHMLLRPRYGWFGLVVLPYYWLYELLEPVVLSVGYAFATAAWAAGWLGPEVLLGLVAVPVSLNLVLSLLALVFGEVPFGRYQGIRDITRLVFWTLTEPFWYRWLLVLWRLAGLWDALRGRQQWDKPRRYGSWAVQG
jgi:cellulose synthase/poly-beta-1,6-N-acetylglucosamine synthase-like glycosyltransferase